MSNNILVPERYLPTGQVLRGGMGAVLICKDTNLERDVAIKFIQDVEDRRRLFDEISALQKIRSKHVVQIFDVFVNEVNRDIGIIQEYVPGDDLSNYADQKNLSVQEYLKILYQIISGISDIHSQGLIHRDIKPNNMKVDQANIIKIFDFGLARFSGQNDSTVGFQGTLGFSAPELYRSGSVFFTQAIDVYSFGVTAWYLSGEKLPEGLLKTPLDLKNLPSFSSWGLTLPGNIAKILDQTLSEEPDNRPSSSEIRDLIGNFLSFGKHRGLLVAGRQQYILEKVNTTIKLDVKKYGSIHIKYNGLEFLVDFVNILTWFKYESPSHFTKKRVNLYHCPTWRWRIK